MLTHRFCKLLARALDLDLSVSGQQDICFDGRGAKLIVANHISYLDVVVIGALAPTVFVTSREIERTPVLGWFCRAGGCAFVERRRKTASLGDLAEISGLLARGFDIMLFPEGSTSDGHGFLRFKSTLLESAVRTRSRVVAMCVRYENVGDHVAWYGDMSFLPHFLGVIADSPIKASLKVLGEIPLRVHRSRKRLVADVRDQIAAAYVAP
jgi:1-acyl-sn-glycerol-3-phosphate acyltransferase